jgi:hypothetical protein
VDACALQLRPADPPELQPGHLRDANSAVLLPHAASATVEFVHTAKVAEGPVTEQDLNVPTL